MEGTLHVVDTEQLAEYQWARALNPNPLRDAGRRLLGRITGNAYVPNDIAEKRRQRAKLGITTIGGL